MPAALTDTKSGSGLLAYALLLAVAPATAKPASIDPFTSDGCSLFPDGTVEKPELWLECCRTHDLAYWHGGTYAERLQADRALEACVTDAGEPDIALMMLAGVRVGGSAFLPTSFRWGYGWPYLRGYQPLTDSERRLVEAALAKQARGKGEDQ
ncbi:hypothetical protein [Microbulbifer yueqingensis]|uniref:Uncharacterized protein n=1 Tax=Microbulbifer yueqingensis TaxID=658219 RepID=A0A1G9DHR6_9GAMM|nr:hypothetical protein [Microbulbifer yueqingensis]SDK63437.1 hypothetical protein SAMN05216212_2813 [Microbulbifer yueqingensis]